MSRISVRKYQSGNQKCTIQRNWHHRVHKTKKNRVKHHTKITAWKALSFVKPSVNPSTIFPPNFENRGVSNNFVEHLVHNEIEMIGYVVKRVEGGVKCCLKVLLILKDRDYQYIIVS